MSISVHREDAAAPATMTCDACGSVSAFEPSLPYIKQTQPVRLWHLEHADCGLDLQPVQVAAGPDGGGAWRSTCGLCSASREHETAEAARAWSGGHDCGA